MTFPEDGERIDYALVVFKEDKPLGYVTCREETSEIVYWQYGGTFTGNLTYRAYEKLIDHCRGNYKLITTRIENTNTAMLRIALKAGFIVTGFRYFDNGLYLELQNRLDNE